MQNYITKKKISLRKKYFEFNPKKIFNRTLLGKVNRKTIYSCLSL